MIFSVAAVYDRRKLLEQRRSSQSGATETIGPVGFEPATCRRGDRTTNMTYRGRRDLVLICNTAPFSPLRRGSKSLHCAPRRAADKFLGFGSEAD
jgi:hypothetical protein